MIEDARNHLLRSTERYDIITADALHPMNSRSWALCTRQFHQFGRERLKPGGIMAQWLPLHDLALSDYKRIVKTFRSVFPNTTLWQVGHRSSTYTLLLGTPDQLRLDLSAIDAKLQGQAIDHHTAGVGLVTDEGAYFTPKEAVRTILASLVLHRVDAPVIG